MLELNDSRTLHVCKPGLPALNGSRETAPIYAAEQHDAVQRVPQRTLLGEQPVDFAKLLELELAVVDTDSGETNAERIVKSLIGAAIGGNFRALQEILNRTDLSLAREAGPPHGYDHNAAVRYLESSGEHESNTGE